MTNGVRPASTREGLGVAMIRISSTMFLPREETGVILSESGSADEVTDGVGGRFKGNGKAGTAWLGWLPGTAFDESGKPYRCASSISS